MGEKWGEGFVFHLSQPASALRPGNRTPPLRAGTCGREGDTFVRQWGEKVRTNVEMSNRASSSSDDHKIKMDLYTHTLLMSVPAVRSRTSSVTSRFGGICGCCRRTFLEP